MTVKTFFSTHLSATCKTVVARQQSIIALLMVRGNQRATLPASPRGILPTTCLGFCSCFPVCLLLSQIFTVQSRSIAQHQLSLCKHLAAPTMSALTEFPYFPQLPAEIRLMIWRSCFPERRLISIRIHYAYGWLDAKYDAKSDETIDRTYYKTRNDLGNLVSGCPYYIVAGCDKISRHFPFVCREANDAYNSFYRLSIPTFSGTWNPSPFIWQRLLPFEQQRHATNSWLQHSGMAYAPLLARPHPPASSRFGLLRLNPETDLISIEDVRESPTGLGTLALGFLFDSVAYDPRGIGISHLMSTHGILNQLCGELKKWIGIYTNHPEAVAIRGGFVKFFEGFGALIREPGSDQMRKCKGDKVFYSALATDFASTRYGVRNLEMSEYPPRVYREVAMMPSLQKKNADATSYAISYTISSLTGPCSDGDEHGGDVPGGENDVVRAVMDGSAPSTITVLDWHQHKPRRSIFFFRRLLNVLGIKEDLERKMRYVAAVWPALSRHGWTNARDPPPMLTRADLLAEVRNFDKERLRRLSYCGLGQKADAMHRAKEFRCLLSHGPAGNQPHGDVGSKSDTQENQPRHAHEFIVGAWVFKGDACGPIPQDQGFDNETGLIGGNQLDRYLDAGGEIDLRIHKPGLMKLDLS